MTIVIAEELPQKETEDLVRWLLAKRLVLPDFYWSALSISIMSSDARHWGVGGFFYDITGRWAGADITPLGYGDEDDKTNRLITSTWAKATKAWLMPWKAALIHVVRDGDLLRVSVALDPDMARWSGAAHGNALPDVLRPPGLPVPPGPNTRRPGAPPEPHRRGYGAALH